MTYQPGDRIVIVAFDANESLIGLRGEVIQRVTSNLIRVRLDAARFLGLDHIGLYEGEIQKLSLLELMAEAAR